MIEVVDVIEVAIEVEDDVGLEAVILLLLIRITLLAKHV